MAAASDPHTTGTARRRSPGPALVTAPPVSHNVSPRVLISVYSYRWYRIDPGLSYIQDSRVRYRLLTYLLVFWSTHQSPASHHLTSMSQSGPCICRDGRLIDLRVHYARASTGGRVPPWGGVGLWWGSPLWASPPGARRSRVSEAPSLTRCYPLCLSFFLRSLASSILVVS